MANLDSLPFDVIDYILNCENILFIDICRLARVSKIFNCIARSNTLWRKKYKQMWPDLAVLHDVPNADWRSKFKKQYGYRRLVSKKLSELSAEFYHVENVSNEAFLYFKDIVREEEFGFEIIINELESILNDSNCDLNLTHKYYAERAVRYMRHAQLENEWQEYLSQPSNKLSLVEGACLISQWCQPTISKCTVNVSSQINDIAVRVFESVKQNFPKHPVVKHGLTDEILTQSLWTPSQCKQVLYYVNIVMFKELKFCGSQIDFYSTETSFIDKVLVKKIGHNITLGIIYAAVAGKLGVVCLPVNFPGHFLLKWLEYPQITDEKEAYAFIDVVESGLLSFKKFNDLQDLVPGYQNFSPHWTDAVLPIKVFVRIAWYLVEFGRQLEDIVGEDSLTLCNSLELLCLLSPDDMEHKLLLARLYMHLGINVTEAISMLQEIAAHDPMSPLTLGYMYQSTLHTLETQKISRPSVKRKHQVRDESREVKYAVGMIMRHRKYKFRCVIYGWDPTCSASLDWIKRMGVYNLLYKDDQPFYYVLVSDGTNRYAAEENLEIDKDDLPILHVKIGRYFESFHGNYYLPNAQTKSEYPDDVLARERALCSTENEE